MTVPPNVTDDQRYTLCIGHGGTDRDGVVSGDVAEYRAQALCRRGGDRPLRRLPEEQIRGEKHSGTNLVSPIALLTDALRSV